MDIVADLNQIGFTPQRLAALLNVPERRVHDWIEGRETPPAAVGEVLERLKEIKQMSEHVHCRIDRD